VSWERLRELCDELRERWDDGYWWADHPELRAALVAIVGGLVGLLFTWLQLLLERRYRPLTPKEA
jgi:hypothetical protein